MISSSFPRDTCAPCEEDERVWTVEEKDHVVLIFGAHDENLHRIEAASGATLLPRGNRLIILGSQAQKHHALTLLDRLKERTRNGLPLTEEDVEGVISLMTREKTSASTDWIIRTRRRTITPRSPAQAAFFEAVFSHDLTFATGPAGTGKTYLAVACAVSALLEGRCERIILSRPAVEAGERLGFLPGDMKEKVDPYLRPLYDALQDMLPDGLVQKYLQEGVLEIAPLAFMRGRTLRRAFILLDEAQNTTSLQMKMFLTRLGPHSRMIVTGDLTQTDLPPGVLSGLGEAVTLLSGIDHIAHVAFGSQDIVRHRLVCAIVEAYGRRKTP